MKSNIIITTVFTTPDKRDRNFIRFAFSLVIDPSTTALRRLWPKNDAIQHEISSIIAGPYIQ